MDGCTQHPNSELILCTSAKNMSINQKKIMLLKMNWCQVSTLSCTLKYKLLILEAESKSGPQSKKILKVHHMKKWRMF
jgi:hypothetical protein